MAENKINIKPENKGKFTNWANSKGMSVIEAANRVMANTKKYSPTIVKRANFAKNASNWNKKRDGGDIVSTMGYRDDSPFRNSESLNIYSPEGVIDMSNVSKPIMANGQYLKPNSGLNQVPPSSSGYVKETPMMLKYGGYLKNKNTYVTKDGRETKRGLWANVALKKKRENRKENGGSVPIIAQYGKSIVDASSSTVDKDAMNAMMKARLAYAQMHGNPAANRMVAPTDNPYVFPKGHPEYGNTGTHYMASYDNYAIPEIQDVNSTLEMTGPRDNEAIRFDREQDARYFANENYKRISPSFYKSGGSVPIIPMYYEDSGTPIYRDTTDAPPNVYQKGGNILTYKNNSDYFNSRARYSDDQKYDDLIRKRVYSGNWGYDPNTQQLHKLNKSQQTKVDPKIKKLALEKRSDIDTKRFSSSYYSKRKRLESL